MTAARASLLLALLTLCLLPASAQMGPGCGPANVKFNVKTTNAQQSPAPQAGKALVYFLQDDLDFFSRPRPTTRFGIDGTWVGATHANSYFYAFVDAGEHHVCANWQSDVAVGFGEARSTAAMHFTFEAGKSYYFRARDLARTDHDHGIPPAAEVRLLLLDSDEAQVLMNTFSFSSSHPQN